MKKHILAALAVVTALAFSSAVYADDNSNQKGQSKGARFGHIEKADQFIGSEVTGSQGNKLGTLNDVVLDLESGRIIYGVVSLEGGQGEVAVPASSFRHSKNNDRQFRLNADQNKLNNAPRYTDNQKQNPGDINFASQVYTHFNESMWWSGGDQGGKGFGNAQKLSDLMKSTVKDSSGKELGSVNNLALNMSGGRVIYVILRPTGQGGQDNALYALPPMALTKGTDQNTLTAGIDQNKLSSAPKFQSDNWQQIQNAGYAMNVYRYYGKEPYWRGENLAPTGRDDSQRPFDQQNQDQNWNQNNQNNQDNQNWNQDNQNSGNPNEGGAGEPTGKTSGFGDAKGIRNLTQRNVQSQNGENLGKIEEVVVDLESGRVLYALLSSGGQNYAVPPQLFGESRGETDALRLNTSKQNLTRAPKAPTGSDIGSMNFVNQLYRHYGQQTWWGGGHTPTGREEGQFSNARKALNLLHRNVIDSSGQQLGKVDNVLIDLHDGRVTFLLLNAPGVAKAGQVFAIPPMAFTKASDNNNLVTGVDKNKLQSAPQVQSHNFNQLNDASFAANVYQFYGKEPYWQGSPTSSQPSSRIYPQQSR